MSIDRAHRQVYREQHEVAKAMQKAAEAARHLSKDELSVVIWVAIAMNSFNRLSILSRHPVRPPAGPDPSGNGQQTARKDTQ